MDEKERSERFAAIKARLEDADCAMEFLEHAAEDMAWLVAELTGAANLAMRLESELKSAQARLTELRVELEHSHRWRAKQYGVMSAKIGQARAEAALARERLRAVIKKMHEERR
jgi:hypothetical protein